MLLFLGFHCSAQYPPRIDRLAHLGLLYDDDRLFHKISDTGACTQTLRHWEFPRFLIVSTLIFFVLSRRRRASLSIRQ